MEAAFFDLDKTVIAKSSGLAFGRDFYRAGFINKKLLLRGVAAQFVYLAVGADEEKMERIRAEALEVTKGWERDKVSELIEQAMGEVITPIIYKEAADLIASHQQNGRAVYLVSSSPEEIVIPLSRLLEVEGAIASQGKVDDEGRYVGELEFYCYGPNKALAIKALAAEKDIDLGASYAYSDSYTDLLMLESVGHPVAVNPDRALKKEAEARRWEIRRFERPVTLRKRLSEIAPPQPALMRGLAATLALAAGYAWLRRRRSPL